MAMSSSFRFRADDGGRQARGTRGARGVGRPVANRCLGSRGRHCSAIQYEGQRESVAGGRRQSVKRLSGRQRATRSE
jgi:hypothetical protein